MDELEELLEGLPKLRAALGWSQTVLAEKVGVHQTTISAWEGGELPSRRNERILRSVLARAFGAHKAAA